jgi:hypothetical protein
VSGRLLALAAAAVLAAGACSGDASSDGGSSPGVGAPAPTTVPADTATFAVIGGNEALAFRGGDEGLADPLRTLWPQQVYADGLPVTATFVNFSQPEATAAVALAQQLPAALEIEPSIAAVWLGEGDQDVGTGPDAFGTDLTAILVALRDGGVEQLVVLTSTDGAGAVYGDVTAAAADAADAELVVVPGDRASWRDEAVQDEIAAAVIAAIEVP